MATSFSILLVDVITTENDTVRSVIHTEIQKTKRHSILPIPDNIEHSDGSTITVGIERWITAVCDLNLDQLKLLDIFKYISESD